MALPSLGYGNASIGNIAGIIAEFGPERLVLTINNVSPLIGSGILETVPQEGEELTVTADVGESAATTYARDFDLRPDGQTTSPQKARFVPVMVTNRLALGKQASLAKLADKDLTKLIDEKLDSLAKSAARHLGRGVYLNSVVPQAIATWSGTAANSTVSVNFEDVSMFRAGIAVNFVKGARSDTIRVLNVVAAAVGAFSSNVAGTVTFINDVINPATGAVVALASTAVIVTDIFALRGSYPGFGGNGTLVPGGVLNSFLDIAGSASFGGLDSTTLPGWSGQTLNLAAPYSHESALQFAARIYQYSGEDFSHALMSPQVGQQHRIQAGNIGGVYGIATQATAQRPMDLTMKADKYGDVRNITMELAGRPVLLDPNCPQSIVVFHNKDHAKLGEWAKFDPEPLTELGGIVAKAERTMSLYSDFTGSYQLYCGNRAAIGVMTGLTGN